MISSKNFCGICSKGKGTFKCEGCTRIFCPKHSIEHRNDLSKQLEEIEVAHDLAFKTLSQQTQNLRQHSLIQFVDQWEYQAIEQIRQLADETRTNLLEDIGQHTNIIKKKLQDLSEQLRQAREDNDFLEDDLQQWMDLLERLKSEVHHPVNITIQKDSTPIVMKIRIDRQEQSEYLDHIQTSSLLDENEQFFLKDDPSISIDIPDENHHTIHSQIQSVEEQFNQ